MPTSFIESIDIAVKGDLLNWRDMWFHCLLWSTGIVGAGLAFEFPELYQELRHLRLDRRDRRLHFTLTSHEASPRWKILAFVGWILIVVGVTGEGVFEGMVSRADGQVQTFNDILLQNAQHDAELAKERAGGAYERAATAEREASQLRKDAEDERLARVKIEAVVAFRSLDDQQKRDIGNALSRFGSTTGVNMWYVNGSPEAELFADDIANALQLAHIHIRPPGGIMEMKEGGGNWDTPITPANAGVNVSSTKNPTAQALAGAIVKELAERGFDAKRIPDQPPKDNTTPGAVVWVTVEARPKGPQGEYKLQAEAENKKAKSKNPAIR